MSERDNLERGIYPAKDKEPDFDAAEDQGNLMGDDEDSDYSGNPPTVDDTDQIDVKKAAEDVIKDRDIESL